VQQPGEVVGYVDPQELDVWDDLHSSVLDVELGVHGPFPPEVDHQFFGFLQIQEQIVTAAPVYKMNCILNDVICIVLSTTVVGHQGVK